MHVKMHFDQKAKVMKKSKKQIKILKKNGLFCKIKLRQNYLKHNFILLQTILYIQSCM